MQIGCASVVTWPTDPSPVQNAGEKGDIVALCQPLQIRRSALAHERSHARDGDVQESTERYEGTVRLLWTGFTRATLNRGGSVSKVSRAAATAHAGRGPMAGRPSACCSPYNLTVPFPP